MSFKTAKEEIALSDEIFSSEAVKGLREQQEEDYGWGTGAYEYKMPDTDEGEWENHTTSSGQIRSSKLTEILAASWMQLFIDVDEDTRKKRKAISTTEQLANYIIWQADRDAMAVPLGKPLLSSLSWSAVFRGGTVTGLYWYEGKDGSPNCKVPVYDPMFSQWVSDDEEITWFCYRDFISKRYIDEHYPKQKNGGLFDFLFGSQNPQNYATRYTFWNDEEYRIACNGDWVEEGYKHGIGHVPINVRTCGAIPLFSSIKYPDNATKYAWQSYAHSTRKVYPLLSKLLSVEATVVAENARDTTLVGYDSVKNNKPPELEAKGTGKKKLNRFIYLNEAAGHKYLGSLDKPGNAVTEAYYARIKADEDIAAGLDPQTLILLARSGNTSLAAEIRSAAEEAVAPFRKCVEESFIWIAEEGVGQFVDGDFKKQLKIEGRDRKREKFYADITEKDVEKSKFDCNLVNNRAQDAEQQVNLAIKETKAGLSSTQTAMIKRNLHQDPDKELENIAQENAQKISMVDPVYVNNQMAAWYKEQGNEQMALYHLSLSAIAIKETVQKAAGLLNPQPTPGGNGQAPVPEQTGQPPVGTEGPAGIANQPMPVEAGMVR